jgi:hypothetical protein
MLVNPYLRDGAPDTYCTGILYEGLSTLYVHNPSETSRRFVAPGIFKFTPDGKPLTYEEERQVFFEAEPEAWEAFELSLIASYGVADNLQQVVEYLRPVIDNPDVPLCIVVYQHRRAHQPLHDGFRFHKHGKYIGVHDLVNEYLSDAKDVDSVWTFRTCLLIEGFYDPTSAISADFALRLVKEVR